MWLLKLWEGNRVNRIFLEEGLGLSNPLQRGLWAGQPWESRPWEWCWKGWDPIPGMVLLVCLLARQPGHRVLGISE